MLFVFVNTVRLFDWKGTGLAKKNRIGKKPTGLAKNQLDWLKTNWIAKNEQYCYPTALTAKRSHLSNIFSIYFLVTGTYGP